MSIYNLDNYDIFDLTINDKFVLQETKVKAYVRKENFQHYGSHLAIMYKAEFILFERKSKKYEFFVGVADDEIISWCRENTSHFSIEQIKCYKHRLGEKYFAIITFKKEIDAFAFKLRWE